MKSGIVFFVEGDTEVEFYKQLMSEMHRRCPDQRFSVDQVVYKNLQGITRYDKHALRVFNRDIKLRYTDCKFTVVLCYDTDVFEFTANPPVNWIKVDKMLREAGAGRVIHLKAKHSIEDWFLLDLLGVCKYLNLPKSTKISKGNGLKTLQELFRKKNRVYVKGTNVRDFIECLDVSKIMCCLCKELAPLCKILGVKCMTLDGRKK